MLFFKIYFKVQMGKDSAVTQLREQLSGAHGKCANSLLYGGSGKEI